MKTEIEIYEDNAKRPEWRWRVKTASGVLGASSEGFARQQYTVNNLKALVKYCRDVDIRAASADADAPQDPAAGVLPGR